MTTNRPVCAAAPAGVYCSPACFRSRGKDCETPLAPVTITIEPTAADLAAIDREWPLIAAELDLLDAEITMLYAEDHGGPTALDWRRMRRAEARVTRAAADLATGAAEPRRAA